MVHDTPPFMPSVVTDWADRLSKATGHNTHIEKISDRVWRATTSSDRVTLTVHFANGGSGRIRWRGSTLAVDGVRRKNAEGFEHLLEIFSDPDEGKGAVEAGPAEPLTMPPARPDMEAPAAVRAAYQALQRVGGDAASIGEEDGAWMIGVDTPTRSLRMGFVRRRKQWGVAALQIILDGVDHSREAGGDLTKALMLLAGTSPAVQGDKKIGTPAASTRSNAVENRRSSVIRN